MGIYRISRRYRHEKAHFPFVILALLMLCACGSKTGATADGAAAPGTHLLGDDVEITDPLDA